MESEWQYLSQESREVQIDTMREWFLDNFEDPAERTPYESREGGYIWIWGGPYNAREELQQVFYDIVPKDVIKELEDELEGQCVAWAPTDKRIEDYDDYMVDDIAVITEFHDHFLSAVRDIKQLLEIEVDALSSKCLYKLLLVNVITAVETYLSDAFINTVVPDAVLMRRLVEKTPFFALEQIPLSFVYKAMDEIEKKTKSYLAGIVWHKFAKVKAMYKDVLDVTFDTDTGDLFRALLKRHDIVHRNGKTKEGGEITVSKQDVHDLLEKAEVFVAEIDEKL